MGLGRAEEEVAGLQALLTPASGLDEHERRSSRTRALQAIFDISNDDPNGALVQSDGLDLVALGRAMSARVAVVADTAAAAAAPPGDSSTAPPLEQAMAAGDSMETGRLGPPDVSVDRASTCGSFAFRGRDGLALEALSNFSSARANVAVFKGRWMYEATVHTPGIQQIGWATLHCPFTTEEGVGDAPDSYAVDGKRQRCAQSTTGKHDRPAPPIYIYI
jgi:SPRY domain